LAAWKGKTEVVDLLYTSEILSSLFKMTFNLKGSVDQEFSIIVKSYKKSFFVRNLITFTFSDSVESHDLNKMQCDTSDILFSAFKKNDFCKF
jgi:hypothetical protein